jgi:hypothetical protein
MAQNQVLEQGGAQPLQVAITPSLIVPAGTPLLVGQLACVAMTSNPPLLQPSNPLVPLQLPSTGNITVLLAGVFNLTVTAKSSLSPSTGSNVNPGDKIYADGGTTTSDGSNITYNFTLDKNSSGILFGSAVSVGGAAGPLLVSGATGVIAVRLKEGA